MSPTKFDFDTEFDHDGQILRDGESYKRFFTQDDIDSARMWGVEEGREMEEGRCAESLQTIGAQMQIILSRLADESAALRAGATQLALAAARKIAGEALNAYPIDTIEQLAAEAVQDLRDEPRLSVRCAPELVEDLAERLERTARDLGFEGAIRVRGNAEMSGADVRLEWATGAIERSALARCRIPGRNRDRCGGRPGCQGICGLRRLTMPDNTNFDLPELEKDATPVPVEDQQPREGMIDEAAKSAADLAPVFDVPVNISAVLGKAQIDVNSLLKLTAGSVVELDRKIGEAIDIYVNNRLVARGEVVVVDDRLGVTMTEIIKDGDAA